MLIGASAFDCLDELPAVRNNIAALSRCLLDEDVWGLHPRHLVEVIDPISPADILDPIYDAAGEATDTLIIYYAGHGMVDRRSNLLLALKGSVRDKPYTATSYESIRDLVMESRAPRRVVILDCCYSGRALGTMGVASADPSDVVAEGADAEGTFVLAAAAENKTALAPPNELYTAFTGELIRLFEQGHPDGPLFWDLDSLYRAVRSGLVARSRPEPQKRDRNSIGWLPIARNRARLARSSGEIGIGTTVSDRYELQRLIAIGGMGAVWEAVDRRLGRHVAVKILKAEYSSDDEFVERFHTEARLSAMLNHPGIAALHDYGETDFESEGHTAYLVMELVNGEPLDSMLERVGQLTVEDALDMLEQTGHALQGAHGAALVHRDVKPGNILITATGHVKITDFGVAKAVGAASVTQPGMVMGTAQYIAPEAALGHGHTPASDIYSLGVVAYEALSGKRPFDGDGALEVAMKHIMEAPPPLPSEIPPDVRELVEHMLTKNPANRYKDGAEAAEAVAKVRSGHRPPRPRGAQAENEKWPPDELLAELSEAIAEVRGDDVPPQS